MKVVISDDYQDCIRHLECFSKMAGHDVTIHNDTLDDIDSLAERFREAEAIVLIRERTHITEELLNRLPHLKIVSQTGAGLRRARRPESLHAPQGGCGRRGNRYTFHV